MQKHYARVLSKGSILGNPTERSIEAAPDEAAGKSTAVSALDWKLSLQEMEGAFARKTIESYRTDLATYELWCRREKCIPFPASTSTVARFLDEQAQNRKVSTVERRLAAINCAQKLLGFRSLAGDFDLKRVIMRIRRANGVRRSQVRGLNHELLCKILAQPGNSIRERRNKALLSVGYDTLARRSELCSLKLADVCWGDGGGGSILVRRSKNDPFGEGRIAYLSERSLKLIDELMMTAGISSGFLFRSLKHENLLEAPMHSASVARIIKNEVKRVGVSMNDARQFSGHSLRVGAAQDMAIAGIGFPALMNAGGSKSPNMVMRYIENVDVRRSGMAMLWSKLEIEHS